MLPSYLNLQHGPPRHPHQHCCDDEDGDEDDHATFIYSDTQHDFPCHHCSNYSNRGHLCNIASKNDNEFMIDHDSSDDQNDSNDMDIKIIWMMTIFVLWSTSLLCFHPRLLISSSVTHSLFQKVFPAPLAEKETSRVNIIIFQGYHLSRSPPSLPSLTMLL